jgi:hypothetical protein
VNAWYYIPLATTPFVIAAGNFAMSAINTTPGIKPFFVPIWANALSLPILAVILIFTA